MDTLLNNVRAQADSLGVKYHHKHKAETIQENIDIFLAEKDTESEVPERTEQEQKWLDTEQVPLDETQYQAMVEKDVTRSIGALVRVKVHCINPDKQAWNGEIISVGSAKRGTWKKYVPFHNVEWHIPKIIYDMMKERKCTIHKKGIDERGHKCVVQEQVPEFNITVLDPLTKEEMDDLRIKQQLAKGQVS